VCASCDNGKGCRGYYCGGAQGNEVHYEHCVQDGPTTSHCVDEYMGTCLATNNQICAIDKKDRLYKETNSRGDSRTYLKTKCVTVPNVFPSVQKCNKTCPTVSVFCDFKNNNSALAYATPEKCEIHLSSEMCRKIGITVYEGMDPNGFVYTGSPLSNEEFQYRMLWHMHYYMQQSDIFDYCGFVHEYEHLCQGLANMSLACAEADATKEQLVCYKKIADYYCKGDNPIWKCSSDFFCQYSYAVSMAYQDCMCLAGDPNTEKEAVGKCCYCWNACKNQGDSYKNYMPQASICNKNYSLKTVSGWCTWNVESAPSCNYFFGRENHGYVYYDNGWNLKDFKVATWCPVTTSMNSNLKSKSYASFLDSFKSVFWHPLELIFSKIKSAFNN